MLPLAWSGVGANPILRNLSLVCSLLQFPTIPIQMNSDLHLKAMQMVMADVTIAELLP